MASVGFENPWYGLLGFAFSIFFVVLLYLSLRRLRTAEKTLEPVRWVNTRRAVRFLNAAFKVGVILTITIILSTPYLSFERDVPVEELPEEELNKYAVNVMILMDVSNSMASQDLKPTRLEVAKSAAKLLVEEMGSKDLLGFISFAGEVHDAEPPTDNRSKIASLIEKQDPHPSTALGTAMMSGLGALEALGGGRAVVLFTDGKSNWGVDWGETIEEVASLETPVFTVFVGTFGVTDSDPLSLRRLANLTGGRHYEVRDENVGSVASQVSQLSREVKVKALETVQSTITIEVRDLETIRATLSLLLIASLLMTWLTGV